MKISMHAEFQILKDGIPLAKDDVNSLSVGAYEFVIDGKTVPFEWEDYIVNERDGIFIAETGESWFGRQYELADYYYEDYHRMNLPIDAITAEFLANVNIINDFHVNFEDDNGDEVDIGDNITNDKYKVFLHNIYFEDMDTHGQYSVRLFVLDNFNTGKTAGSENRV